MISRSLLPSGPQEIDTHPQKAQGMWGSPQYPSQRHKHLPGLSKRSFGTPAVGSTSLGLLIDREESLHGHAWEQHLGLC